MCLIFSTYPYSLIIPISMLSNWDNLRMGLLNSKNVFKLGAWSWGISIMRIGRGWNVMLRPPVMKAKGVRQRNALWFAKLICLFWSKNAGEKLLVCAFGEMSFPRIERIPSVCSNKCCWTNPSVKPSQVRDLLWVFSGLKTQQSYGKSPFYWRIIPTSKWPSGYRGNSQSASTTPSACSPQLKKSCRRRSMGMVKTTTCELDNHQFEIDKSY